MSFNFAEVCFIKAAQEFRIGVSLYYRNWQFERELWQEESVESGGNCSKRSRNKSGGFAVLRPQPPIGLFNAE
ncbi:MAG TPA: hypothetical protein DD473_17760 [Planctomycetaceae bacterium]|nr:hypothetical protein [Planctomycetaceae bacterium]